MADARADSRSKALSHEEIAKGVLEGWCVRHDVALVPAEGGWVSCPKSDGGLARAYTDASEVVVEFLDHFGPHIIRLAMPKGKDANRARSGSEETPATQ